MRQQPLSLLTGNQRECTAREVQEQRSGRKSEHTVIDTHYLGKCSNASDKMAIAVNRFEGFEDVSRIDHSVSEKKPPKILLTHIYK